MRGLRADLDMVGDHGGEQDDFVDAGPVQPTQDRPIGDPLHQKETAEVLVADDLLPLALHRILEPRLAFPQSCPAAATRR